MPDRFGIDLIHVLPRGVAIFIAEESDDGTANVAQPFEGLRRLPMSA
jgi:hypothetical protein